MFGKKRLVLATAFILTGCGHIYGELGLIKKTSQQQYTEFHNEPALKVPPHLANCNMQNDYPIPAITPRNHTETVSVIPPGEHEQPIALTQHRSFWTKVKDWF